MAYKKPTLVEMYVELHLRTESLSEARFFDIVPQLKQAGFADVELASGLTFDIRQGLPSPRQSQRVRCWDESRTQLVQLAEDIVTVNLTGDYPGWDSFIHLYRRAHAALVTALKTVDVASLNLCAIDTFDVPKDGFRVATYLQVDGTIIPRWYSDCSDSLDLDIGRGFLDADGYNRQVHVKILAAGDPVKVVFRTQFHHRVSEGAQLEALLGQLHEESNATFESMITDEVRSTIMGGRTQ